MDKLDRLGWAAGIAFRAYGTRVGIRVSEREVLDRLEALFPPGWKPAKSRVVDRLYSLRVGGGSPKSKIRRYNLLYVDMKRIGRSMDLDEIMELLASDMQFFVAEASKTRVFTHAGVVGWRGRAIVLPGKTFSGKTTLVAALVKAGATYYSDEYAIFDSRGRVHPFPRPLGIREGKSGRLGRYPVEELGGFPGSKPLPVGLVVVSEYKPGARWRPRTLSPGQAALALLANTVSARFQPREALATLKRAVGRAPVLTGARGGVEEVVETMLTELERVA
jgi:hypothetical protein